MKMRNGPASTGGAAAAFARGALFGAVFAGVFFRVDGAGGDWSFGDFGGGRFFGGGIYLSEEPVSDSAKPRF
jgi:hypothetical protein